MHKDHAILARDPPHLQHRQRPGDGGDGNDHFGGHGSCKGFNCFFTTTSTPQATTTIIPKPATTAQPVPTTKAVTQTPASATAKQQTTSGVATIRVASPSTSKASPTVTSTGSNSIASASDSQSSVGSTGSLNLNQNSDMTASQAPASYTVYQYLTTDSNGYTIDVTSTSFFAPGATSGLGANGVPGTDSSGSSASKVGAIVGGAVGVISFILLVLFAMWFIRHRRKNRTPPSAEFLSSSKYPFTGSSDFRFRQLSDSLDQQSISEYPFEPPRQSRTESPRSFLHMREKSETY